MATNRESLPDVDGWEALYFQMGAYPLEGQALVSTPPSQWQKLTGEEPAATKKQPFMREESGFYQRAVLSVLSDPIRIWWMATPQPVLAEGAIRPQTLKPFRETLEWFVSIMSRWLHECPPVYRLGFAAKLVRVPEGGAPSVNELLNSYLHPSVQVDPKGTDFIYRINRRCPSKTPGLEGCAINRIATWSTITVSMQFQAVGVEQGGSIAMSTSAKSTEYAACSVDLDINSAPERKDRLASDRLEQLLRELAEYGTAIAQYGEAHD